MRRVALSGSARPITILTLASSPRASPSSATSLPPAYARPAPVPVPEREKKFALCLSEEEVIGKGEEPNSSGLKRKEPWEGRSARWWGRRWLGQVRAGAPWPELGVRRRRRAWPRQSSSKRGKGKKAAAAGTPANPSARGGAVVGDKGEEEEERRRGWDRGRAWERG
jgi:hypothetical protein